MQDMAELIVIQAKTMPIETGVALECNGARIAKVAVTGGFGGYNVTSADGKSRLIFPMAEVTRAVESFLTEGRFGVEAGDWERHASPTVRHANGLRLLTFSWNKSGVGQGTKADALCAVERLLLYPPVSP